MKFGIKYVYQTLQTLFPDSIPKLIQPIYLEISGGEAVGRQHAGQQTAVAGKGRESNLQRRTKFLERIRGNIFTFIKG